PGASATVAARQLVGEQRGLLGIALVDGDELGLDETVRGQRARVRAGGQAGRELVGVLDADGGSLRDGRLLRWRGRGRVRELRGVDLLALGARDEHGLLQGLDGVVGIDGERQLVLPRVGPLVRIDRRADVLAPTFTRERARVVVRPVALDVEVGGEVTTVRHAVALPRHVAANRARARRTADAGGHGAVDRPRTRDRRAVARGDAGGLAGRDPWSGRAGDRSVRSGPRRRTCAADRHAAFLGRTV